LLSIREPDVCRYGGDDVEIAMGHGPGIWNQSSGVADDQIDVEGHCDGNVGACETQEPNELTGIETTVRAFE